MLTQATAATLPESFFRHYSFIFVTSFFSWWCWLSPTLTWCGWLIVQSRSGCLQAGAACRMAIRSTTAFTVSTCGSASSLLWCPRIMPWHSVRVPSLMPGPLCTPDSMPSFPPLIPGLWNSLSFLSFFTSLTFFSSFSLPLSLSLFFFFLLFFCCLSFEVFCWSCSFSAFYCFSLWLTQLTRWELSTSSDITPVHGCWQRASNDTGTVRPS